MRFALVAMRRNETNTRLVRAGGERWTCLAPDEALEAVGAGDVALGRLDVLASLDGIDGGLRVLGELEARGVRVLNPASALIATHDYSLAEDVFEATARELSRLAAAPAPPALGVAPALRG